MALAYNEVIPMHSIITKQFNLLTDCNMAWDFFVDVYETSHVEAPFFEYAVTSSWMNKDYLHLCRFWLDGKKTVGFAFYESPVTSIRFALRPGYEFLAEDMIAYAENAFPSALGKLELCFTPMQTPLIQAAVQRGYRLSRQDRNYVLDMTTASLDYELTPGFHYVDPVHIDPLKLARCTWQSFNEWELGPFENWDTPNPASAWNPHKSFTGVQSSCMAPPPHATYEHSIVIANEDGDYVCFSGMWWVPENYLAYMEPLCTVPSYQRRGLASAALTRHYRTFKALGGRWLTGGGSEFYKKIGYNTQSVTNIYTKPC